MQTIFNLVIIAELLIFAIWGILIYRKNTKNIGEMLIVNEIERAIQEFEDNLYRPSLKPTISDTSKIIALKALQEKYDRENPNIIKTKIVSQISYDGYQGLCGKRYTKSKRK